jgi:hypothetical protein
MRTAHVFIALSAVSAFAIGCSSAGQNPPPAHDSTGENASQMSSALEEDNGGLTTEDEAPYFADPEVEQLPDFEVAPPEILDAPGADDPAFKSYHVVLLWGHLPTPADATAADPDPQPVDWTGSIAVDRGAVGVERTLAFDARDHLVRDGSKQTVSFASHTLPLVDGLFVRVVVPAAGPQVLHFKTAALTTDIDLSALADKVVDAQRLGDGRNGLVYMGYPDRKDCARGVLFGRWVKVRPALGKLRGRVLDGDGATIGHVRGLWGHAPKRDANVFFGKYIGVDGHTRGLFGGRYADGRGEGIWGTRSPKDVGGLQIAYSDGYDKGDGRGIWMGRWSEKCTP